MDDSSAFIAEILSLIEGTLDVLGVDGLFPISVSLLWDNKNFF